MAQNVILVKDDNCYYLTQDLRGMSLYQRTKTIKKFINQETKVLEDCIENEIRAIFQRNGINVYETTESVLNALFSALNEKGKDIAIVDLYKDKNIDKCIMVGTSPNKMTVWLEDDTTLECGISVKEINL